VSLQLFYLVENQRYNLSGPARALAATGFTEKGGMFFISLEVAGETQ